MGSGKSTTMRHIAARCKELNIAVVAYHERSDPHPVRATDTVENWFKPWLELTYRELATRGIARWARFVEQSRPRGVVSVFDGQLFHGDLTNLFLMEAPESALEEYCSSVVERLLPLSPFLIYFYQRDIEAALQRICTERGEEWVNYQLNWKLQTPYSVRHGLVGMPGFIILYQRYRQLTDRLFEGLDIPKLKIENAQQAWSGYYAEIERALGLSK